MKPVANTSFTPMCSTESQWIQLFYRTDKLLGNLHIISYIHNE